MGFDWYSIPYLRSRQITVCCHINLGYFTDIQLFFHLCIEYFHIHELCNNKYSNYRQNKGTEKRRRNIQSNRKESIRLHTSTPRTRTLTPDACAYFQCTIRCTITFVILNACVFHSQWKHSKYYAVCWIFTILSTSFHSFCFHFSFLIVCVFGVIFIIIISSKYI